MKIQHGVSVTPASSPSRSSVTSDVSVELSGKGILAEGEEASRVPGQQCCSTIKGDVDFGRTLGYHFGRYACGIRAGNPHAAPSRDAMRIIQVGANTGDNKNDHIVQFLQQNFTHAVLLEPVPWVFERLQKTYARYSANIQLLNAAMSTTDGTVSFTAPKNSTTSGWFPQMGGINLPKRSYQKLAKHKQLGLFEQITVPSATFETVVRGVPEWVPSSNDEVFLDAIVIDTEGHDATVVNMVLDTVEKLHWAPVPIIQYEWKHCKAESLDELHKRLHGLGYCVTRAHYDDIAYRYGVKGGKGKTYGECSETSKVVRR